MATQPETKDNDTSNVMTQPETQDDEFLPPNFDAARMNNYRLKRRPRHAQDAKAIAKKACEKIANNILSSARSASHQTSTSVDLECDMSMAIEVAYLVSSALKSRGFGITRISTSNESIGHSCLLVSVDWSNREVN